MQEKIRITYLDIIKTFSILLYEKFDIPVVDVIEDYDRACFMTDLDIRRSERFMTKHIDDYMTMTIYYFPYDRENNTAELAEMREELRDLFLVELDSLIPVNKHIPLEILELMSAVVDDVLQVKIDMQMSHEIIKYEDVSNMEKLKIEKYLDGNHAGTEDYEDIGKDEDNNG